MNALVHLIDAFNQKVSHLSRWLTTFLVIVICGDVIMRYLFSSTKSWILELEWHMFALIFLFGAAYALREDQHVRVDLFYSKMSARGKAWVNLLGTVLFLIPWCVIVIQVSYYYAENSLMIGETSPEPGGLPARYVIKFAVTVGFILLLVQGVAQGIKALQVILKKEG